MISGTFVVFRLMTDVHTIPFSRILWGWVLILCLALYDLGCTNIIDVPMNLAIDVISIDGLC